MLLINAMHLKDIKKWKTGENARSIVRSIVGIERLRKMTPAGIGRFEPIPTKVLNSTQRKQFEIFYDTST